MDIFSRFQQPNRWNYLTDKNIKSLLSTPPYRQGDRIFALCPYCFNPIQVILKNNGRDNHGIYYAKHLQKHSPFANKKIDQKRLDSCLLSKSSRLLTKGSIAPKFSIEDLDVTKIRKALYFLLHVSMSNDFVSKLVSKTRDARLYCYADEYNYPFMMLLEMKYLLLNNRRFSNYPQLLQAIKEKCKFFSISTSNRLITNNQNAKLYFIFDAQGLNEHSHLNYLDIKVVEKNTNSYNATIFRFRTYIKGFNNLLINVD